MSLLSKLGLGKSQAEQEATRRRQIEESEINELRRFAVALPNNAGADLLAAVRAAHISSPLVPPHAASPLASEATPNGSPAASGPSPSISPTMSRTTTHSLEDMVLDICKNPNASSKTLPVRLARVLIARFQDHFAEPATRLPTALDAIYAALLASPQNAKRLLDEGLPHVLRQSLDMSLDELELRTQQRPSRMRDSVLHASDIEPEVPTSLSNRDAMPRTRSRAAAIIQPNLAVAASSSISSLEPPLLHVARITLRCIVLLIDNPLFATVLSGGSGKRSDTNASMFSFMFRSGSKSAASDANSSPNGLKRKTPLGGSLTTILTSNPLSVSSTVAHGSAQSKNVASPSTASGVTPTSATSSVACSAVLQCLLDDQPEFGTSILRCFGLQCRCSLFSRTSMDRRSVQEIFHLTVRLVTVLLYEGYDFVISGVCEGCCILLARLKDALVAEDESELRRGNAESADADHVVVQKQLLGDSGRVLQLLAECIQLWPSEAAEMLGELMNFADLYGPALRAVVQSTLVAGASAPSENDAAQEAVDHFLRDTFSDRHWRDMYDSLQTDTVGLVLSPKVDTSVSIWLEGLSLMQQALRISQDKIRHAIYTRELPANVDHHLNVLEAFETTVLLSGFTTVATEGSPRYARRPLLDDAAASGDSVMHRWLVMQALQLLPLHPVQIKPSERSRVQAAHRLAKVGALFDFLFGDVRSGWNSPRRNVQRLGILFLAIRYMLLPDEQVVIAASPQHQASLPSSQSNNNAETPSNRRSSSATAAASGAALQSTSTLVSPIGISIQTCLESIEHYSQMIATWPMESIEAALVPLCGLLRWALVAREQGATELMISVHAVSVLESCATAVSRAIDSTPNNGDADSARIRRCGEAVLESTLDTVEFFLRRRPLLQAQLEKDPSALIQLMLHPSARLRASELVQMLLTYAPESDGESDMTYMNRMSLLVSDVWDAVANSREIPDDVYLALLHCVRTALNRVWLDSPFHHAKLQFALCNPLFAADCFLRLVHPLNAGWHTLDRRVGRSAVLATLTGLMRANPAQRERFHSTVGGRPLVQAVLCTSGPARLTRETVCELLGVVFEDSWSYDESGELVVWSKNTSVQNERLLEALLEAFRDELQKLSSTENGPVDETRNEAIKVTGDALMCLLDRLKHSFRHCRSSVWACAKAHAFELLVSILAYTRDAQLVAAMESCLSLLTARHIDILQLKRLLGVISHADSIAVRRQLVPSVVEVLHSACHTHLSTRGEPKNYIALRTQSGATGISVTIPQFPKSGFTVSFWMRWEGSCDNADSTTLFSVAEGVGGPTTMLVTLGTDGSLRLRCGPLSTGRSPSGGPDGNGREDSVLLEGHQVHPHQWMHLVFAHKTAMFGTGELSAFVNGKELRAVKADIPLHSSGAMSVVIGSTVETLNGVVWMPPLHGQVNAIYVFSKAFSGAEAHGLFLLGANYATCFSPNEKLLATPQSHILYNNSVGERVVVCLDPRLSEKGKLFNAAFVSKASSVKHATGNGVVSNVNFTSAAKSFSSAAMVLVKLHEGAFTCHTSSIIDTTCSLGALQSLILPLLVMQVNSQLPISSKSLTVDVRSILHEGSTALRDTLKLLDSLIIVDLVRAESLSIGTFPIVAHVLEKLGGRVTPDIPQRLGKICCSVAEWTEIFRVSFASFFLNFPLFSVCLFETRRAFVDTMRSMSKLPNVRSLMRELGIVRHLVHLIVRCSTSQSHDDASLRDILFSLMDTMLVDPVQKVDAESLFVIISAVHGGLVEHDAVAHVMLARTRSLLLSRPKELAQQLGRLPVVSVLTPLLKHDHCSVRCEAVRILCHLLRFSRTTQQLLSNSGGANLSFAEGAQKRPSDAVIDDISLTIVADWLRTRTFDCETYMALRCAACGSNASVHAGSTAITPLLHASEPQKLVFAPVVVPILMLAKDASKEMRAHVLHDVMSLVSSTDASAWEAVIRLEGWFILILDVMLAEDAAPETDIFFAPYKQVADSANSQKQESAAKRSLSTRLSFSASGRWASSNDGTEQANGVAPNAPQARSILDLGVQIIGLLLGNAACSPHHDLEDLELLIAYILHIRYDENVRILTHALLLLVLEHVSVRAGGLGNSNSDFGARGSVATNAVGAASPHRQAALLTAPTVERNVQQLFYTLEDQMFFGNDISCSRGSAGKAAMDGFVTVDLEEIMEYDEGKSHVFVTQAPQPHSPLRTTTRAEVSLCASDSLPSGDEVTTSYSTVLPVQSSSSVAFSSPMMLSASTFAPVFLSTPAHSGWLHADIALQAMQFVSSSVALVNNTNAVGSNVSAEPTHRRGGIQRIYLRILRTSTHIMALENDYIEAAVNSAKAFQSLLDRTSATGFFSGRRSATDVQDDPAIRSALSLILIFHEVLQLRHVHLTRGGSGGRNRFINQRIIERLKAAVRDNLPILKELGAFQKQTAAHLDSTHRVALKTLEWLENPNYNDVDEYFEISRRDDYQRLIHLLMDVVRTHEEVMTSRVRDVAVRGYSNCLPRSQQLLKRCVMSRQLMVERVDALVSIDESRSQTLRLMESVLGDATSAKVAMSLMASHWAKFVARLKGTIWDMDPYEKGVRFVKLSRIEQRPLQHMKLIRDREGTDHRDITSKLTTTSDDISADEARKKRVVRLKRPVDHDGVTELGSDDGQDGDENHAGGAAAGGDDGCGESDAPDTATVGLSECDTMDDLASVASFSSKATTSAADGATSISAVGELSHLMHCWSCTLVVSETALTVLIDDENKAYNQPIAKDAQSYLIRPRNVATWPLQDVVRLAPARRFRMRRTAVEVYFRDRTSILVNLIKSDVMRGVVQAIKRGSLMCQMRSQHASNGGSTLFAEPIYILNENPRKELLRQKLTEQWRNREISNMEYLLGLNMIAGRTTNDLTQYPIFPWVLADYTSPTLDLTKRSSFRDLSLPIGLCGGAGRREEIEMRYQEMLQMGDVPFHYFTHYSSPAVVLYFMIRLEPFTTCQVLLQGGRFDHADRMFHAVAASWAGVTKNIQDVKEMIPECYYLPELYMNHNGVNFGVKQDGQPMSNAQLPPWANGDPYTLVYMLREALESDVVSSTLHHWIDLIFGFKQRGKHAVEALNLFHPHTYELESNTLASSDNLTSLGDGGARDVDEQRVMIVDSLDNIGQTPVQLFVKRHPERKPNLVINPILEPALFGFRGFSLASLFVDRVAVVKFCSHNQIVVVGANGAAFLFRFTGSSVLAKREATPGRRLDGVMKRFEDLRAATVSYDMDMSPEHRLAALPFGCMPSVFPDSGSPQGFIMGGGKCASSLASPTAAPSGKRHASISDGQPDSESKEPPYTPCAWRNTCVLTFDDAVFCVYSGFFDNSCLIRPMNVPCDELRFTAHRDRVLCVAASEDSRYLVTGGRDTTFVVWHVAYRQKIAVEVQFSICGHEDEPTVCAVNRGLDVVATASRDGQWMIHALSTGKLEHCLRHPEGRSVDFILLQSQCFVPNMLIASRSDYSIHQYSINATLLRSISLPGRLVHWAPSGDPAHVAMIVAPANVTSSEPSAVMFYHSFFLTLTSRIAPTVSETTTPTHATSASGSANSSGNGSFAASEAWSTAIDCGRNTPQQMITGTAGGQLVLIRTELKS